MKNAEIKIVRHPYEEPYHLCLRIDASNGHICGGVEHYCSPKDLDILGKELMAYLGKENESVIYERGSEGPRRCAYFFCMKVLPLDSVGHGVICFRFNNNRQPPYKEITEFCLRADVADINRLGSLLAGFGKLDHHVLYWSLREGKLFKDEVAFGYFAQEYRDEAPSVVKYL